MEITVYRSRFEGATEVDERAEALSHVESVGEAHESRGADDDFSDDIKKTLLEALSDGSLDMFRAAYAMATLLERYRMTQRELSLSLGISQSAVANKLRLLRLSPSERKRILGAALTERHARALLRLRDGEMRSRCLERVIAERMSVGATEELVSSVSPDREVRAQRGKGAIRDLRFFSNSIDRAVDLARRAGVEIELRRRELERGIEISIRAVSRQNEEPAS